MVSQKQICEFCLSDFSFLSENSYFFVIQAKKITHDKFFIHKINPRRFKKKTKKTKIRLHHFCDVINAVPIVCSPRKEKFSGLCDIGATILGQF